MIKPPKRLKVRPQWRGLPIPYITMVSVDGTPDFRVTDEQKRMSVIQNVWCQLCGQPLGKWFFFTGGTDAAEANYYFEPAAHLDCLIYAMQVCPFIVGRIEHADIAKVQKDYDTTTGRYASGVTVHVDDTFSIVRNPWWIIKKANGWSYAKTKDGTILLHPWVVKQTDALYPETMTAADWKVVMEELSK